MLNFLKHFFNKKAMTDPRLTKIEQMFEYNNTSNSINNIYYIGGFPYNEKIYDEVKNSVNNDNFVTNVNSLSYDSQMDNVEIYFIKYTNKNDIVFIYDPVELYESSRLLDIVPYLGLDFKTKWTEEIFNRDKM